ncbi:MAG TPA: DegQ family serine endoprotease [Bryobacterales bacterium]|nr:DegQ family serine endoprotease [Bryobacterales bacterium]
MQYFAEPRTLAFSSLAAVILVLGLTFGANWVHQPVQANTAPAIPALSTAAGHDAAAALIPASGTFAPTVKQVAPAVVSITVSKMEKVSQRNMPFPFFGPEGFGAPFGGPPSDEGAERRRQGAGSGVIVSDDGYIVTNHHVIDGADKISVHLSDRRTLEAKLVGTDAKTDIAVLQVEDQDLPALPFGNSDNVEIGDIVLAVGNPFGIGQTVTMGIVGATGRGNLGIEDYEDFIQTDAAINPGNSGGALVNTRGELIGINTAILARGGGGNQGVGFAVPVNLAHHVMTQLVASGRVARGFLGVGIQDLDPKMAKAFELQEARGAVVRSVQPGGPAAEAGLKQGDVIVGMNGESFRDSRELRLSVAAQPPGSTVKLAVLRDGAEKVFPVKLEELPEDNSEPERSSSAGAAPRGLSVDELTPAIARQLNLAPGTQGVVVVNVKSGSAADEAGLRSGDVIREVARQPVSSVAEYRQRMGEAGDSVLLLVQRGDNPFFVVLAQ